jgi:aminotransferase
MNADKFISRRILKHVYEIGELQNLASKTKRKLIALDVADPSNETPEHIKKAMIRALARPGATHYTRIRGLPEFVQSVSEFYSSHFGLDVDPMNEVLATVGSGEALYIVFSSLITPGDEFILPNPTFPTYASLVALSGGVSKFVPTDENYHLDTGAIQKAVTNRTKAIVLCTPTNPTGTVFDKKELEEVLRIAEQEDLVIISDENYSQVTYDGKKHLSIASLPGAKKRTIVVNGLSKVYAMTGWRLGYAIAPEAFISQFEKVAYEIRGSVNTAVQYAGGAALQSPKRVISEIVRGYNVKRKLVVNGLREAGFSCRMPEGGFEAFPRIPDRFRGSIDFTKFLVENAGVLVKPGIYFGPAGDKNFRVVYCKDADVLEEALERMSEIMTQSKTIRV